MQRPRIALFASVTETDCASLNQGYLRAIWKSGGDMCVMFHDANEEYVNDVCEHFDGFLFCGGEDIDPKYYGEEKSALLGNVCSMRDEYEEKMFAAAYKTGKPILGICRGMQVINVFLGGSLRQHIDGHKQTGSRETRTHSVELCEGGVLRNILGENTITVNSFHHQIVKKLADGLVCDAISTKDGYIEAFHHKEHPFLLGVQWHPECYYELSETSSKIFETFIRACRK